VVPDTGQGLAIRQRARFSAICSFATWIYDVKS
jgi:hypothetical protein